MQIIQGKFITLKPDNGYLLTDGEVYSDMVFLGVSDSPSRWHDILIEEVPEDERIFIENSLFNQELV